MQQHTNLETYPCDSFAARIAGVSSGAQVPLPQMLGPPTGSMPIRLPQVRKRRERVVRGIICSVMIPAMDPSWAVSLISPVHHLLPHAFIHTCIHAFFHSSSATSRHSYMCLFVFSLLHIYVSYLIIYTLFALFTHACLPQW